jgi:thiol-disulfide isomerase/thioredoxin
MMLTRLMFRSLPFLAASLAFAIVAASASFALAKNSDIAPPHLDETGHAGYREFLAGGHHRGFAIAPGGAWAWVSDMPDPDVAESEAIRACSGLTEQRCAIYALDGQVVFDRGAWAGLWGPYAGAEAAAGRPVGTARGTRFPDLALKDPGGDPVKLSDLRGRIVFLHFWGSWCAPCQIEFPELQGLYDTLKGDDSIAFVFVQAREDIARSRRWARLRGFSMPFYDSGAKGPSDHVFGTADGSTIDDRVVAPRFPATYILDSHGLVMFSRFSPPGHWAEYEPLLRHAAEHRPE